MGNVPAENFIVCCLTVSCRTHCSCSLAHSLIFAMFLLSMGITEIGFNFAIELKKDPLRTLDQDNSISSGGSI